MTEPDIFAEPTLFGSDEDYLADLFDRFIMPPYSVLDRKQGNWMRRKKQWLSLGIKSELGRDANLIWAPVGDNPSDMVQRISFNGEPCFRGIDVAEMLKHAQPRHAILDQVPAKMF